MKNAGIVQTVTSILFTLSLMITGLLDSLPPLLNLIMFTLILLIISSGISWIRLYIKNCSSSFVYCDEFAYRTGTMIIFVLVYLRILFW